MSEDVKIIEIDITKIKLDQNKPPISISEKVLIELAESIKEFGVINPIVVYEEEGDYILIGSERRWLAAQRAELKTIPALIVDKDAEINF